MVRTLIIALSVIFMLLSSEVAGQRTSVYDKPEADFRLAMELFNKEKFGAARNIFEKTIQSIDDKDSKIRINAQYYKAICAVELFHPDAEKLLTAFVTNNPTHSLQSSASFQMGNLQYRNRDYEEALHWYARVDILDLTPAQREERQFKIGYSHFMTDNTQQAKHYFYTIQNPQSLYYSPATYYYGHISYSEGNYETALIYFQRLSDDDNFGPITPYYITHIYFLQSKYDELLDYAPPLLEEASTRRAEEISRMIGEAWYAKNEFANAIPYLEDFHSQTRQRISREDNYQLGFAYYKTGDFENAIDRFEKVTNAEDSLAQNALYHLADSYLETGQGPSARNAFRSAYRMDFIPEISQSSLFNYAKLSFELSLNPFNEAILSFQKYIENYPQSHRVEEAYRHLVDLYLTSRNYKDALTSLEALGLDTPVLKEAYQRVAYMRGLELFNNGDFRNAIQHFEKSGRHPENITIRAQTIFWRAEAHFRLEEYEQTITTIDRFLVTQGAFSLPEYNKANYTLGYAHFKLDNYSRAVTAFRKFINDRDIDTVLRNDAYLRIADSYFITNDYGGAIDFYNRAIALEKSGVDYAIFQKAVSQGVTGRFENKAATLHELLQKYPRTNFADDARYELANTYVVLDNSNRALQYYAEVIEVHPNSSYVKSSMLKTGLIHYNQNRDEQALDVFREVIEKYPGSAESQEALVTMRNIYVGMDRVDEFFAYSDGLSFADVSTAQRDTLSYTAAENRYMEGDCLNAAKSFENYIENFPQGIFILNAHFYKAECDFRFEEMEKALQGYNFVLDRPKSRFSENAAMRAAQINFRLSQYQAALESYRLMYELAETAAHKTDALIGQLRSAGKLEKYQETINIAHNILERDRTSNESKQEAHLHLARAALGQNNLEKAQQHFTKTKNIAENIKAAEAKYNLAYILFRQGDYEQAEELIFDYINLLTSYDYWLAKTFILLADNYLVQDNAFQAKNTLNSIIENYDGEDLRNLAQEKLEDIERQEALQEVEDKPDTLEIDFSSQGSHDQQDF